MNINKGIPLTEATVDRIYKDCLATREDIENEDDYTKAEGIDSVSFFNTEKLNNHKNEVKELVGQIRCIDKGISFLNMSFDHNGSHTTSYKSHMCQLIKLGVASGFLQYTVDRQCIDNLPVYVPFIVLTYEKFDPRIIGNSATTKRSKVLTR